MSFFFSLFRLFIWEILHSTIRKMDKHVQKIQQELEAAKDKLEKQQHKRVNYSPSPSWSHQEVAIERIYWLKVMCLSPVRETAATTRTWTRPARTRRVSWRSRSRGYRRRWNRLRASRRTSSWSSSRYRELGFRWRKRASLRHLRKSQICAAKQTAF